MYHIYTEISIESLVVKSR